MEGNNPHEIYYQEKLGLWYDGEMMAVFPYHRQGGYPNAIECWN